MASIKSIEDETREKKHDDLGVERLKYVSVGNSPGGDFCAGEKKASVWNKKCGARQRDRTKHIK